MVKQKGATPKLFMARASILVSNFAHRVWMAKGHTGATRPTAPHAARVRGLLSYLVVGLFMPK
jgi:hypothetical protein